MEIEFALPDELTSVEQYKQIIDAFIAKHFSDRYFAYAIHEKIGALFNGQRHPHVHIIFSERLIDDVEKIKERSPKNFFKYPARKKNDGSLPFFWWKIFPAYFTCWLRSYPKWHTGVISSQEDDNPQFADLKEFRALRLKHILRRF